MKALDKIKRLIPQLPEKDIHLGYTFLEYRDFESLQELVNSAIYKVNKNRKSDNPKAEYQNIDITNLNKLKTEVDLYSFQCDLPISASEVYTEDAEYYNEDGRV